MRPIQAQTPVGVRRTHHVLYRGRTLCRFQHTQASEPNSNKLPPVERPPQALGDVVWGLRADKYEITQVSTWKPRGPVCRTYQAIKWVEGLKETFVLKEVRRYSQVRHLLGASQMLQQHPNLQTLYDVASDEQLLIYRTLPYNVNGLIREHPGLPYETRKEILKRALTGLAALHNTDLAHLNIRPSAILVDYGPKLGSSPSNGVHKVQLGRFEDAVLPYLSKQRIDHYRLGIEDLPWKSPEFWIRGRQARPSDVFSFGLTSVNFMLNNLNLKCADTGFPQKRLAALGGLASGVPTQKQLAKLEIWFNHFGDADALMGLLEQVKDEPNQWYGPLNKLVKETTFGLRKPLPGLENHVDLGFVDVVTKMTHLDPSKRITAREALEHEWFANIEVGPEHMWYSPFKPRKNQPNARQSFDDIQTESGIPIRKIPHFYPQDVTREATTPRGPEVVQKEQDEALVSRIPQEEQDELPVSESGVVLEDEDKPPVPKPVPAIRNLIRKVYVPLTESTLKAYRQYDGNSTLDPDALEKRSFQVEKLEPRTPKPEKDSKRF
ncbi:uncharacterized protein PODANS_6_1955 [Podospora anserina S mat+]|uniref:Cyclin-dependent kinase 1 n=1 Tax=Podospora anserina (strain S / ATCC MYA-4624 / DSM 980 / FGSC 10383) TaxID=515849 RepID=B2B2V8_PODAN|nr:uncharacterized protein PODANS_6_1955 [Podospora anserina S mat+]CAP71444.1 unnamed protein product [Podospora anserina S mat+]CDP30842.1 Putative Serine/Threonine protein kinase [Podospora anserina S mat+]